MDNQDNTKNSSFLLIEDLHMHFQAQGKLFGRGAIVRAVDGVSMKLAQGKTIAVVGESGSGKTTLGRAVLRLLKPTSGRVVFDGTDIASAKDDHLMWYRRRAQGISQDPFSSLDPYMTIDQLLEEPLLIHKLGDKAARRQRVQWSLEQVRLLPAEEIQAKYPHTLSGGQRQRVGIARALMLQPELIVADEPVSMIDASSRAEILYLLRELQQLHQIAFIYITHDLATARHFSQRIAVMYLGRIVEEAPTGSIIDSPLHPYTKALMDALPEPDPSNRHRERAVVTGEPPSPANIPPGCRFHLRCPLFMEGKCDVTDPPYKEVNPDHWVACHLY